MFVNESLLPKGGGSMEYVLDFLRNIETNFHDIDLFNFKGFIITRNYIA